MDLGILFKRAGQVAADKSPAILTAIGVTGTLATAYLFAKAGFQSVEVLREAEEAKKAEFLGASPEETEEGIKTMFPEPLTKLEMFEATWKLYTPGAASAALTVAAIICSNQISDRRTAALASAYSIAEKSYSEWRSKTTEKVGKKKAQEIRDEIAQERVTNNPPSKSPIMLVDGGTVLCQDGFSGRYFMADMETVRKAENDINWDLLNDGHASLTDFWDKIGLPRTTESDELGWNTDHKFELDITTALSENDRPCIAFGFRHPPKPLFYRNNR